MPREYKPNDFGPNLIADCGAGRAIIPDFEPPEEEVVADEQRITLGVIWRAALGLVSFVITALLAWRFFT